MNKRKFDISSAGLHMIAMVFMLCDHLWATVIPGNNWLTYIGRLAFPIFAFMLVEGYFHTHNLKKYALRLLIFAVISEIPFNLMCSGSFFYPVHQNVLWTMLIGLGMIHLNEKASHSGKAFLRPSAMVGSVFLGGLLGILTFCDYNAAGVLMILVFYFSRGNRLWCYVCQFAGLYYINFEILKGLVFPVTLFGRIVEIPQQGLAVFSLLFIWLYRGRKGYSSKWFQQLCYWFYPAHMLLLWLIGSLL